MVPTDTATVGAHSLRRRPHAQIEGATNLVQHLFLSKNHQTSPVSIHNSFINQLYISQLYILNNIYNVYIIFVSIHDILLMVWNISIFAYIGNFIIPIDELICFRGVGLNHQPAIQIHHH